MITDSQEKALDIALKEPESTKARILKSAEQLFARNGFKGTTTRDIADSAGVNMALLYYHWGLKEELWNVVHFNLFSQFFEFSKGLFGSAKGEDKMGVLKDILSGVLDYMADNPDILMLMQQSKLKGADGPRIEDIGAPFYDLTLEYFNERTDLDFDPIYTKLATYCILGALEFIFIRPDLIRISFGDDPDNLSREFRHRAGDAIWTMAKRFGRAE